MATQNLADSYPRKVYYFLDSGRVMVKKLRNLHNNTIFAREKDYSSRLQKSKVEGDVELFG